MTTESLPARGEEEIAADYAAVYQRYAGMVYKVCFAYMKNSADAEDISADVFVSLIRRNATFKSEEHQKAWLLRTAINLCKNSLKHWRRKSADIDECVSLSGGAEVALSETLSAILELPDRYKAVIYLYYYERYTTAEVARILQKPQATIRVHLHEARKILKGVLDNE